MTPTNAGVLDLYSAEAEHLAHLERRIVELTEAVTARDNFLAVAAHELRNPITPILGQVQRLQRLLQGGKCTPAETEAALGRIGWLIELYVKRATILLDVSRITAGKLRLLPEAFDVSELAEHVVDAHYLAAQHSGCEITMRLARPAPVVTDRLAVEQILDNLLINAIRYGAGRPIEVTAELGEGVFRLIVADQGIGISEEAKARIFERFERAVQHGGEGGFGVGLWVVAQLVDALGGAIAVDSVPDQFTRFAVTLPDTFSQASSP